ncbi:DUF4150 domain-containing protein [Taylorella equigenitalis]|uniref:Uncharacterized protein n=2 Tax=Taylorella equigenitalis TaxID=29575 RepID=A0A654KH06_TAYEM|nr:DUF4150 domain-containing protein [Taylorella equigenitalis]ADU91670.1 hypothetical protein TEQUI_0732 [Taylorella equigenitalis MCE9]ASY29906.1 type VI secretion protein [Taylorella equigenitalis]ASY37211.1 DUF4150 domain-containing protein [Taylorella equigenitalis]ASY40201.1 type VI secretion protein [Taylorella equigenitalis]ASY41636.1 type VI secretion protein [Taylorella equigenitalis]
MFANQQLMGMDLGFPDVCRTPAVPIPYPNMAMSPTTIPIPFNWILCGGPSHNMMSVRVMTIGDQPGIGLGMVSQTITMKQNHVTGAFTEILRGTPATRMTSMGPTNMINCPPAVRIVPSQFKYLLLCA